MNVQEIMTRNPACAQPSSSLQQIAKMMVDNDCGGIPICDPQSSKLVGFVTDRDIVCRTLAQGVNPMDKSAQDVMSTDMHTIKPQSSMEECVDLMERFQVRRVPVVDQENKLVGIVAQADLARQAKRHPELREEVEEVLEEVSEAKVAI